MITAEQKANIRPLFHGEHWKIGTIAAELGVHPKTVRGAVKRTISARGRRPVRRRPMLTSISFARLWPNYRAWD